MTRGDVVNVNHSVTIIIIIIMREQKQNCGKIEEIWPELVNSEGEQVDVSTPDDELKADQLLITLEQCFCYLWSYSWHKLDDSRVNKYGKRLILSSIIMSWSGFPLKVYFSRRTSMRNERESK